MGQRKNMPAKSAATPVVVFGVDEDGKPKGGRFPEATAVLATKAAKTMDLSVLPVTAPDIAELAAKVPVGKVYANRRAFVPFIRQDLYEKLLQTHSHTAAATSNGGASSQSTDNSNTGAPSAPPSGLPRDWAGIQAGQMVIAQASMEDGWWEAVVVERIGDILTLRWRDYPKYPNFARHYTVVALVKPPVD